MATSIADLLDALDHETTRNIAQDPYDAARALDTTARLLIRIRDDGIGADNAPVRDDAARRLAEACAETAVTFPHGTGRLSDLAGVANDMIGQLRSELTEDDRWHIAASLAPIARRCAAVIARSGPYASVPQLLAVADRSRELLRAAAISPPNPDGLTHRHVLIPGGAPASRLTPEARLTEAAAELLDQYRRPGRSPLTVRELLGTCIAAEQMATASEHASLAPSAAGASTSSADAWQRARLEIRRFADRPSRANDNPSAVLSAAARTARAARDVEQGRQLSGARAEGSLTKLRLTAAQLPALARACESELHLVAHTLVVVGGRRPLNEERVAEWLGRKAYLPNAVDLVTAQTALELAARTSQDLLARMHHDVALDPRQPSACIDAISALR